MKRKTKSIENAEPEPKPGDQVAAPELLAKDADAGKPNVVQNGRIHATYLGLGLERDKGRKLVHLDFSFRLVDGQMNDLIPEKVAHAWNYLAKSGDKLIEVRNLPAVTIDVYNSPKDDRAIFHNVGAPFSKAVVAIREEVGKGKTIEVVRFSFRLRLERTPEVIQFAAWRDEEDFWLEIPRTQRHLTAKA